ncbi:MAG: hypothetical protein LBQ60_18140 [Bacteroidales bacterium]|jgi:hypothetical protein|nr:hypothetical protein [Bacteroidales bacterium]
MNTNTKIVSFCVAALVSLCGIIFHKILGHEFLTAWDDAWQVMNVGTELWTWENIRFIFTEYYYGQYSPVNQLLYTILYRLVGYDPFWFHFLSLVLHTGNTLLVFFILRRLLLMNLGVQKMMKASVISFAVAALFAVHPLQVEVVAWVSASKVLVYSFFYLLAVVCYIGYIQKKSVRRRIILYISMLLFFALSFGGKEQAIVLPVCLLLVDLICRRDFRTTQIWVEKIPVFVLSLLFAVVTLESHATHNVGLLSEEQFYPFLHRIVFACYAFCEYIVKIIIPVNLFYIYPFPMLVGEPLPLRFWIYPVFLLMIGLGLWKYWKQRPVWLGMLWFLIHIALMLHIVPLSRINIIADRYVYLALPGIFFIIVWYLVVIWEKRPKMRIILTICGLIWFLFLNFQSYQRTQVWHDNKSLKTKLHHLLQQREDYQKETPEEETIENKEEDEHEIQ